MKVEKAYKILVDQIVLCNALFTTGSTTQIKAVNSKANQTNDIYVIDLDIYPRTADHVIFSN